MHILLLAEMKRISTVSNPNAKEIVKGTKVTKSKGGAELRDKKGNLRGTTTSDEDVINVDKNENIRCGMFEE